MSQNNKSGDATQLLLRWQGGDESALTTLFPLVYFALFTLLLGYRAFFVLRDRRARARAAGGDGAPGARGAASG